VEKTTKSNTQQQKDCENITKLSSKSSSEQKQTKKINKKNKKSKYELAHIVGSTRLIMLGHSPLITRESTRMKTQI
jgi:hypothetical protein